MTVYGNDYVSEILVTLGEEGDQDDFNNMQRHLRSQLNDGVYGPLARVVERDYLPQVVSSTGHAWTIGNGAQPFVSASTLAVSFTAGLLGQRVSVPDGTDPGFLWYHCGIGEVSLTAGAADATNPRWDIVQIKIEHVEGTSESRDFEDAAGVLTTTATNKRRRTQMTATIKAGTAAAIPTEPSPDAGYVKLCAIHIAATATVITPTTVRDYRMPVGYRVIDLLPGQHCYADPQFTVGGYGTVTGDGNATPRVVRAMPQMGAPFMSGRLLAVGVTSDLDGAGATALLRRYNAATVGTSVTTVKDISASVLGAADRYREVALWDEAIWLDGSPSPSCQGGAGNATGYGEATIGAPTTLTSLNKLELELSTGVSSLDTFGVIRFIVAGM
ncbi:MAG: hypothetical protein KAY59_10085 [Acidobacteria bacterium]|nr:hypothetical protein [Acidobacteriota bacterium]